MNERVTILLEATTGTADSHVTVHPADTELSPLPYSTSRFVPLAIEIGQAYYWGYAWQLGEQESRAELVVGRKITFDDVQKALHWLVSEDP